MMVSFGSVFLLTQLISLTFGNQGYIGVEVETSSQDYYFSVFIDNIDASLCGDSINNVQLYENDVWRGSDQYFYEDSAQRHRYAWDYKTVAFSSMEPISLRINMASGRAVDLWAIIQDNTAGNKYTSDQLICDGTLAPTSPTKAPTTKQPTPPTTPYPTAPSLCFDKDALDWRSYDNQLKLNGNTFRMKGLSWFGYETPNNGLYGLDYHNEAWYFQWMKDHGFNAMRLPFAGDYMSASTANQEKYRATIEHAGEYGIFVMPDFHSKNIGSWTDGLNTINKADTIAQWAEIAELLKDEWNVFIADIFNEPHDVENSGWSEWIDFCEDAADAIWAKGVNWLVAVEGTNWQCSEINCAWGENLEGVRNTGVTFDNENSGANRFVWSPHVYGADVTGNGYSIAGWDAHWGYLVDGTHATNEAASLIGEFGTTYQGGMVNWLDDLVDYLVSIEQQNTFFWCLNPNSGDTGGLLQADWTTDETAKLAALDELQPNPSIVQYNANAGQVCVQFEGGSMATPAPVVPTAPPTRAPVTPAPTKPPVVPSPHPTPAPVPTATPVDPTPQPTPAPVPTKAPVQQTPQPTKKPGDYIVVEVEGASQDYYFSIYVDNIDASACGNSVVSMEMYYGPYDWRANAQMYWEDSAQKTRFAWQYDNVPFSSMEPISLRINMASGDPITLWGIVERNTPGNEYVSTQTICGSVATPAPVVPTPAPVAATPAPTSQQTLKVRNCADAGPNSYKAELVNLDPSINLKWFRMRHDGGSKWLTGQYDANTGCYVWEANTPYSLPLDFKIRNRATGQVIRKDNIINSWSVGTVGDLNNNYAASLIGEEEAVNDNSTISTESIAIIIIVIIAVGIIVVGAVWYFKRKQGTDYTKKNTKDSLQMTSKGDNTPSVEDGINNTTEQTNIMAVEDDD